MKVQKYYLTVNVGLLASDSDSCLFFYLFFIIVAH